MRRKSIILLFLFPIFLSAKDSASIRKFNFGVSWGVGGIHGYGKPAVEARLYGIGLRYALGITHNSYGLGYEYRLKNTKLRLLKEVKRSVLVAEVQYHQQYNSFCLGKCDLYSDYRFKGVLIGLKSYGLKNSFVAFKIAFVQMREEWGERYPSQFSQDASVEYSYFPLLELNLGKFILRN